jgi:hypothetical protein
MTEIAKIEIDLQKYAFIYQGVIHTRTLLVTYQKKDDMSSKPVACLLPQTE